MEYAIAILGSFFIPLVIKRVKKHTDLGGEEVLAMLIFFAGFVLTIFTVVAPEELRIQVLGVLATMWSVTNASYEFFWKYRSMFVKDKIVKTLKK